MKHFEKVKHSQVTDSIIICILHIYIYYIPKYIIYTYRYIYIIYIYIYIYIHIYIKKKESVKPV